MSVYGAVFVSEHTILQDDRSAGQWVEFHFVGLRIPAALRYHCSESHFIQTQARSRELGANE